MKFAASGWGTTPLWSTELYFDKIRLSSEAAVNTISCSPVSYDRNDYEGVELNVDLKAYTQDANAVMVAELYDTDGVLATSSSVAVSNPTDTVKPCRYHSKGFESNCV